MIGVCARESEHRLVEEFFELFKTPWEHAVPERQYDVLLSADGAAIPAPARLTLIYGSAEVPWDREAERRTTVTALPATSPVAVLSHGIVFPIYGGAATFSDLTASSISTPDGRPVDYRAANGSAVVRRVGYDLFQEVGALIGQGQPVNWAATPTLELHIACLKEFLRAAGISYVEIPPRPHGSEFTCCLTHDIDFFGIRRHRADRTLAGFLMRGTVGTIADLLRGRRSIREAVRNLAAVLSLPLVWLGVRDDFWHPLHDYARADRGLPSTFFIVPFKGRPGVSPDGTTHTTRAVAYGAGDVTAELRAARADRVEFALHGIDAWRDAAAGGDERAVVSAATGVVATGVRMHWLYFSDRSPHLLEQTGFDYDSTCGFNEAIGYRAGTMQPFRLPGCDTLLELPLSIMDTALFYPDRMGLDRGHAMAHCETVVDHAIQYGGAIVVNWHDRSLAPERQWHKAYDDLLDLLQRRRVWFATAKAATDWFRWRRSIRFGVGAGLSDVVVDGPEPPTGVPPARIRLVDSREQRADAIRELPFSGQTVTLTP